MSDRGGYNIVDQYATYFITCTAVGWLDIFTRQECRDIIIDSLRHCIEKKGLNLHSYVIMSSHIHVIASAKQSSEGLSSIVRDFKSYTAKKIISWITKSDKESRREWLELVMKYHAKYNKRNSLYQVWQHDNQPKLCAHPKFTKSKLDYIHNNPVAAGIVKEPEDYVYSSAIDYVGGTGLLKIEMIDFGVEEGYVFG